MCLINSFLLILQRCRLCADHLIASELHLDGSLERFCQKCGKTHPLEEFEGLKRSCRVGLQRHNLRQKALRSLKIRGNSPSTSNGSLSAGIVADQPAINGPGRQQMPQTNKCFNAVPAVQSAVQPLSQIGQHLGDLTFDNFLLSSGESDHSLVDWLLSAQDYPAVFKNQQPVDLSPISQLPDDFFNYHN